MPNMEVTIFGKCNVRRHRKCYHAVILEMVARKNIEIVIDGNAEWVGALSIERVPFFISCQVERRAEFSTGRPDRLDIPTPYLFRRMLNLK